MDIFNNLIEPQSGHHLELIEYLLILAKIILLIYAGVLFGSSMFSFYCIFMSGKKEDSKNARLSRDFIDLITSYKMFGFGLGIVPFLSSILIYSQLLYNSNTRVVEFMLFAFLLFVVSQVLIYVYKHSLHLKSLLIYYQDKIPADSEDFNNDFKYYAGASREANNRSAVWGIIFLLLSLWIFVSSSDLAVNQSLWDENLSLFWAMISTKSLMKFMHFLTAGIALTGMAFIVKIFFWDKYAKSGDEEYTGYAKKFNLSVALIFSIVQPLFLAFNLYATPKAALSFTMFGVTLLVFLLIFLLIHFLYAMVKEVKINQATVAFYLLIIIFSFIIIKEQIAFSYSNKQHVAELAKQYDDKEKEFLASLGKATEEISGEEIYNAKCTACHEFDKKKVGPPHNEVLPKYLGKEQQLVDFIMNPVKVNPAYPKMPNQGLKPNEAKAVAEYMLKHYKSTHAGGGGQSAEAGEEKQNDAEQPQEQKTQQGAETEQ